ncbi:MAG: ABC transporter substrate-binding protein [Deltaproteobacteria bacterium]|nr:ABC transporter substrate-binding protein [Deltaproteobacteria bacterium]MBI2180699.1 ABC transporter substrate-binding protein [Deltaproteobacteria bacterium]MBI2228910.1 ABC transporter substrate-binding protein [Deltaproteobacteria bacterium]MBI2364149.1 ABC transporter substrate-binding protein [Deltaproteobacteria bacterium]MBI3064975.1 ABC transporter substrate-binding protein [Deltaproteobacteria bacterium]
MTFRKVIFAAMVGLMACSLSPAPAGALENIVIAYPTTSSQFTPLWFARDVGLYERYGLDGKLVFIQGGSLLLQAMLAGQAQAAQNGVAETAVAILRGADVRMLGVTAKIFPYTLIVAKGIKSAKDLVGGKLAVNRLGDVSAIGSQIALRKLGLNPDKDVTMLQVGGSPQRLAALQSGAVQAAALDFMSGLRLSKMGYTVLAQVSLSYPYLAPVASGRFLRENPAAAEAFVKAFVEGIARFKRNRDEGIKAVARYMKSNETDILNKAYDFIANEFYAENLEPDSKSFQELLEEISEREPLAKKATIGQVFDLTIARKLEKEGFFKTVFKR